MEDDGLTFSLFQMDTFECDQLHIGADHVSIGEVIIELDDLVTGAFTGVFDSAAYIDAAVCRQFIRGKCHRADFKAGVAQSMSEGEERFVRIIDISAGEDEACGRIAARRVTGTNAVVVDDRKLPDVVRYGERQMPAGVHRSVKYISKD